MTTIVVVVAQIFVGDDDDDNGNVKSFPVPDGFLPFYLNNIDVLYIHHRSHLVL